MLDHGRIVERVWAALFARAGGRIETATTDDPDLHLVVDGVRLGPAGYGRRFRLCAVSGASDTLLLRSRAGVPSLLGLSRSDHWPLGVAFSRIVLLSETGFCCTDGEFALRPRFFRRLAGPLTLLVHTEHYPSIFANGLP